MLRPVLTPLTMKPLLFWFNPFVLVPAILGQPFDLNLVGLAVPAGWHAQSMGQAIACMALFGAVVILMTMIGCRLFDQCTPGELREK